MFYSTHFRFAALGAVIIISCLHLFMKKGGNITKSLLLPSISVYYLLSVNEPSAVVLGALFFSWLGDVLLIKNGTGWFVAGGIGFMLSHFLFITAYIFETTFTGLPRAAVIAAAAVYIAVSAVIISLVRDTAPEKMAAPLFLYLFVNGCMNVFAFMRLLSNKNLPCALTFAGAVLFFISDCTLFMANFYKKKFNSFFPVMFTYIAGEILITTGLIP